MRDPSKRLVKSALWPMIFVRFGCAALVIFLSSCSGGQTVLNESQKIEEDTIAIRYSIIFIIHGDNDYLYHDTSDNKFYADEETLAEAKRVAEENPQAEVFIFHKKPASHFLFFFPLKDGEFYYYRNGLLRANELYWRDQEQSNFNLELELYRRFRIKNEREMVRMFLYFGHEIPEFAKAGYDASYPDRTFAVQDLASGLKEFTTDSRRFDLLLLSTCYGGTPYTIGMLGNYAQTIIASPDNLHLSYFDLKSLESLDISLKHGEVPAFANKFAQQIFDKLTKDIQTVVSVVVYDVDSVQEYLHSVYSIYEHSLNTLSMQISSAVIEYCDCADIPAYIIPTMNTGVNVFYRSARFGRSKHKLNHSGWECWKE